jgi:hypothetical protein
VSEAALGVLLAALHERLKIQSVQQSVSVSQTRLMLRVPPASSKAWIRLVFAMLRAAKGKAWTLDISKMFVVEPDERFGWRVIIQGAYLTSACAELAQVVRTVPLQIARTAGLPPNEEEVQLVGSPNRSKTAGLLGQVVVGGSATGVVR